MVQKIITSRNNYIELDKWIKRAGAKKIFMVCDGAIKYQDAFNKHLKELKKNTDMKVIAFRDFCANPLYEAVVKGVELFHKEDCSAIMAVGGGSAIDVAKCIKLYSNMDSSKNYLEQVIVPNDIPFLAMPTTAGTGSEATRYAVIYYEGAKQSVTSESCIPGTVLFDPECLKTLPIYQKKSTMMDALCHAIESFWSINSTEISKNYSRKAIELEMENMDGYLGNTEKGNTGMLMAAYLAGKAINITQTTAGHAMCYKIAGMFGVAHGHAAILCNRKLFPWMIKNADKCVDPRGKLFLKNAFQEIANAMGCTTPEDAAAKLEDIFNKLNLEVPIASAEQYKELKISVNPVRLKNHPILLDEKMIDILYHEIMR